MTMTDDRRPAPVSITLRPGVRFPDHRAVNSDVARTALDDIVAAFGIDSWEGYDEGEDRVRRAILEHYALSGRAPSLARLAEVTAFAPEKVRGIVHGLRERDLVVMEARRSSALTRSRTGGPSTRCTWASTPFTRCARSTPWASARW